VSIIPHNSDDFVLCGGIKLSPKICVPPTAGFRNTISIEHRGNEEVTFSSMLLVCASRPCNLALFLDLLDTMGVSVVGINARCYNDAMTAVYGKRSTIFRIDLAVLKSILWDHRLFILEDGKLDIAVGCDSSHMEVHRDDHGLIKVYCWQGENGPKVLDALFKHGVNHAPQMRRLDECEHLHIPVQNDPAKSIELYLKLVADIRNKSVGEILLPE
jgi:hypothetical protein